MCPNERRRIDSGAPIEVQINDIDNRLGETESDTFNLKNWRGEAVEHLNKIDLLLERQIGFNEMLIDARHGIITKLEKDVESACNSMEQERSRRTTHDRVMLGSIIVALLAAVVGFWLNGRQASHDVAKELGELVKSGVVSIQVEKHAD